MLVSEIVSLSAERESDELRETIASPLLLLLSRFCGACSLRWTDGAVASVMPSYCARCANILSMALLYKNFLVMFVFVFRTRCTVRKTRGYCPIPVCGTYLGIASRYVRSSQSASVRYFELL